MNDIKLVKSFTQFIKKSQLFKEKNELNILEITGMGTQEIKHSNVLAWLFGDNQHNLQYNILFRFLKKVFDKDKDLSKYFSDRVEGRINIYREKKFDIDILIEDIANGKIFVIENKVFAKERKGQLIKYEKAVKNLYKASTCKIYYIYLTSNLSETKHAKETWISADYNMIVEVLIDILKNKKLDYRLRYTIESYIGLLKIKNIMKNDELKDLCEMIWKDKKYREALNILLENQPKIDQRLIQIGIDKGTPLTLTKKYGPKGYPKITYEVILEDDGLLYWDNKVFFSLSTLINNGFKSKVFGKKVESSGQDGLSGWVVKNTGERLSSKKYPKKSN